MTLLKINVMAQVRGAWKAKCERVLLLEYKAKEGRGRFGGSRELMYTLAQSYD
jgi:hypothetical protein